MKVVLSRKGFDSTFGGVPSPILPGGQMVSFPIPSEEDECRYSNVLVEERKTVADLMAALDVEPRLGKQRGIKKCHLDPDLDKRASSRHTGWKPSFGQVGAAQAHLMNQKVGVGDLFLYFGWFAHTEFDSQAALRYRRDDQFHAIFGYLQVGEILHFPFDGQFPEWLRDHPHATRRSLIEDPTNAIYVAADRLSLDLSLPGAGLLRHHKFNVLTKTGMQRTFWSLDKKIFGDLKISYHSDKSWQRDGTFRSVARGQEFVIEDNDAVTEWAKECILRGLGK